ncbi:MAG: murein biosynthesis integral membrane protein MurJ [Caldisericia bacterium]
MNTRKLLQDIGVVSIVLAGARILGFIREILIVPRFGLKHALDAWNIASSVPMTLTTLLTAGILSIVFIPIFTKYVVKDELNSLSRLVGVLFMIISIGFSILVVLGIIFAKPLILLQTRPETSPETIDIAVRLFKIMMPTFLLMAWSGLLTAIHHSFQRFVLPALGSLFVNICVVGSFLLFADTLGVYSLAYGFLAGSALQLLVQLPGVFNKNLRLDINFNMRHPALVGIGSLIIPVLLGSGVQQLKIFFEKYLASGLSMGAVTAYNTAWKVSQLPLSVFVMTISMIIFPQFAESVAKNKPDALKQNILWGLKMISYIIIPAGVGILVLAEPMSVALFQRGAVTWESAVRIAAPLAIFAIGLLPWSYTAVLLKVFYSMGDTKTPVWIACISVSFLVTAELLLVRFGTIGIAIGSVMAAFLSMLLQVIMVRKKIGNFGLTSLLISMIKITISSLAMGGVVFFLHQKAYLLVDMNSNTGRILALTFVIVIGILVYIGSMYLINRKEFSEMLGSLRRRK